MPISDPISPTDLVKVSPYEVAPTTSGTHDVPFLGSLSINSYIFQGILRIATVKENPFLVAVSAPGLLETASNRKIVKAKVIVLPVCKLEFQVLKN